MASSAGKDAPDHAGQLVVHPLEPVFDETSRVLVLGTMPSPKSREVRFYYGNPQNRFWRVMAALWDEPVPTTNGARRDLCLRHHVALWDVLASCTIHGASDASIRNPVPNDVGRLLSAAPIARVFCTGGTATRLYQRLVEPSCGMPCTGLPSTSPANARMRLGGLIAAYEPLRRAAEGE
ncbi:MAG: DNA-deoxyinosine glycosylase [Coriobacteriaceae bacterium]|uniref:DNA-deoxyinosine glycosylase n=1 Tax=Tractidigestivibacter sp. TaxID=2847320 RepID=UPI002A90E28F|nr:DNA-deoxyinosine glycosylase [Tractidigestivibacter sp.]MCI6273481.1 DNA-deoxyinosine glycosylase [Coriobacteriaceae bacterium]MCI6547149.1 DNA-deoxyinosine glycosylase [Coriobacteriaceae bacterium]MCI7439403.1 DNA-deoxyinosine glycosylase [Coriobacteriaceae bacterium]MDD7585059.1 DNA-deoxyinosine glycosylase [Coriobacteriaceae bacterium]MDY5271743.1 DNA-deoxyinosine glycosylase [Tractidigestivibacter sp.]